MGSEEGRMTFSKLGKVFSESLAFCQEITFWSSANEQCCLCLLDDWPLINPEMLSVPFTREQCINYYIGLHLKYTPGGANNEDIEKKDSVLLRIIQPTQEQQTQDDQVGAEHAISTTITFAKDKYKLSELRFV